MTIPKNWRIDPKADNHVISDERPICSVSFHDTKLPDGGAAWNREIAQLIAQAPALLKALRELLEFSEYDPNDMPAHEYEACRADAQSRARAALSAAETE